MVNAVLPLSISEVTRCFGSVTALDNISLTVEPGEMVGLLGPNGAGKSTLITLLSGLRPPTAGDVHVFGADPRSSHARARIGITPQETGLPANLKVREVVDFVSQHFSDPLPRQHILSRFGLDELENRPCGKLSGGQRRRLAVALALVGQPDLLVLDEPTTGLDIDARHVLWQGLRDYHGLGGTVLLTSHYLEEVQALAQRVVVIDQGRILVDNSLEAVLARATARHITFEVDAHLIVELDKKEALIRRISRLNAVLNVDIRADGLVTILSIDADSSIRDLVYDQVLFQNLTVRGATLEEAFLALTAHPERKPGS